MECKNLNIFFITCIAIIFLGFGCEEYEYKVEMEACESGLQRKLVCTGDFNSVELERINRIYPKRLNKNTFIGTFSDRLPNDIGGAGFYSRISTKMGTSHLYTERLRGDDDLVKHIEDIKDKVNKLVNFFCGWLDYEFGNDSRLIKLREFCRNDLRRDVENYVFYYWLTFVENQDSDVEITDVAMRLLQYLLERDYLDASDVQWMAQKHDSIQEEEALGLLRKMLAKKLGYLDPNTTEDFFALLTDEEKLLESMGRYLATTDEYLKYWNTKKIEEGDPNIKPPDPFEFLSEEIDFEFELWPPKYKVEAKIKCHNVPFNTNGIWDANTAEICWSGNLTKEGYIPEFFYCLWSNPEESFQKQHFGTVLLEGEELANYCSWRIRLCQKKAEEWKKFLSKLEPTDSLENNIQQFCFSDEKDTEQQDSAKIGRQLLLDSMKKKPTGDSERR